MPQKLRSWSRRRRRRVHECSCFSSRPSNATRVHGRGGVLEGSASDDSTHDHDNTATPTSKGWRSDVSIILPGWSLTLVGPGQYPRYTSAVKDGRPWVAQATHKAAKHHKNTIYTKTFSTIFLLLLRFHSCQSFLTVLLTNQKLCIKLTDKFRDKL